MIRMQQSKEPEYDRCIVCRRKLKNPECRRTGMGRKCEQKYSKRKAEKVVQLQLFE